METEKFKVEIKEEKKYGIFDLTVTNNGYQWMSITLRSKEHLKKIRCAITNFLDNSEQGVATMNNVPSSFRHFELLVRRRNEIIEECATLADNYKCKIIADANEIHQTETYLLEAMINDLGKGIANEIRNLKKDCAA